MRKFGDLRLSKEHIWEIVSDQIDIFLGLKKDNKLVKRPCAWCSKLFQPRHRYHFLCSDLCRRFWYKGWFKPRD